MSDTNSAPIWSTEITTLFVVINFLLIGFLFFEKNVFSINKIIFNDLLRKSTNEALRKIYKKSFTPLQDFNFDYLIFFFKQELWSFERHILMTAKPKFKRNRENL